jgi:hypothetical protein
VFRSTRGRLAPPPPPTWPRVQALVTLVMVHVYYCCSCSCTSSSCCRCCRCCPPSSCMKPPTNDGVAHFCGTARHLRSAKTPNKFRSARRAAAAKKRSANRSRAAAGLWLGPASYCQSSSGSLSPCHLHVCECERVCWARVYVSVCGRRARANLAGIGFGRARPFGCMWRRRSWLDVCPFKRVSQLKFNL